MRQLFWRLNIQQYRNIKYKKNKDRVGEFEAQRGRGPSHELGIDTDAVGTASASRDDDRTPGTPRYGSRRHASTMIICLTNFADHQHSSISLGGRSMLPRISYVIIVRLSHILRTSGRSAETHTVSLTAQPRGSHVHR